jgi:hypothetical protein
MMISFEDVEWAINVKREILAWVTLSKEEGEPTAFVLKGNAGYVVFGNKAVFPVDIPLEILDSFDAATNILIVALMDDTVIAEKRVQILRKSTGEIDG